MLCGGMLLCCDYVFLVYDILLCVSSVDEVVGLNVLVVYRCGWLLSCF